MLVAKSTPTEDGEQQAFIAELAPYLPPALTDVNVPCYVLDRSGRVTLWSDVLARKGGQYSLLARMPEDPSQN